MSITEELTQVCDRCEGRGMLPSRCPKCHGMLVLQKGCSYCQHTGETLVRCFVCKGMCRRINLQGERLMNILIDYTIEMLKERKEENEVEK